MASGILGGGNIAQNVTVNPYTTPEGKVTTATLLIMNSGGVAAIFSFQVQPANMVFTIPASGMLTISGIILGSGQSVNITSHTTTLRYMLTGWESNA